MNDRFRFRAWNKEEKKMYYDAQDTYDYMTGKPVIFATSFGCLLTNDEEWEVEQCTGLKDKNGNLIYEGDIVRFEIVDNDSVLGKTFERICEICFGKGDYLYSFVCKNDAYYRGYALLSSILCQEIESIEIIGNTHEQAEQKDVK